MRKRRSLLRLGYKRPKYFTGHGSTWDGDHYLLRDCGEYLLRYHLNPGEIEIIPIKPVTLEDLGLKRLANGRIVKK